jgi:hypothetical protein
MIHEGGDASRRPHADVAIIATRDRPIPLTARSALNFARSK